MSSGRKVDAPVADDARAGHRRHDQDAIGSAHRLIAIVGDEQHSLASPRFTDLKQQDCP